MLFSPLVRLDKGGTAEGIMFKDGDTVFGFFECTGKGRAERYVPPRYCPKEDTFKEGLAVYEDGTVSVARGGKYLMRWTV